MGTLMH